MANIITLGNSINPVFNPANVDVIEADFRPVTNANRINPVISESYEQVNNLFPTSSWNANNWDSRTLPWEGLENAVDLSHLVNTDMVWQMSGLDYGFVQDKLFGFHDVKNANDLRSMIVSIANTGIIPDGFLEGIKDTPKIGVFRDDKPYFLGDGTKRFVPIGNERTRELCDILYQMGFKYENAGAFDGGKVTYVSMKWRNGNVAGEEMSYYVVVINSFDGTKPFGVYITPIRISCKNTMNLAIKKAVRFWKLRHTTNAHIRLDEVEEGLNLLGNYIGAFEKEVDRMKLLTCDKDKVKSFVDMLFPITEDMKPRAISSAENQRAELMYRWEYAPDIVDMEHSAFRFINAISDYADHTEPLRKTSTYREKRFSNNLVNNDLLNKAYDMVNSL